MPLHTLTPSRATHRWTLKVPTDDPYVRDVWTFCERHRDNAGYYVRAEPTPGRWCQMCIHWIHYESQFHDPSDCDIDDCPVCHYWMECAREDCFCKEQPPA